MLTSKHAMLSCWRDECTEAGIDAMFTHGRKPVEDRTVKSRLGVVRVSETQFADDVTLYASSRTEFEMVTRKFVEVASKWGLTVGTQKTKGIVTGEGSSDRDLGSVQVDGGEIEMVNCFTYLGSNLSRDGNIMPEVSSRIEKATRAFGSLRVPIFNNSNLSIAT